MWAVRSKRSYSRRLITVFIVALGGSIILLKLATVCLLDSAGSKNDCNGYNLYLGGDTQTSADKADTAHSCQRNRQLPLIFIGGVPRSGTTLIRAMLDAHPDIRCGPETRIIPRLLQSQLNWLKSAKEKMRLLEAGITKSVLNAAVAAFILEVIEKHGEPAPRLCNKDPLTLKMGTYVSELFPNAKFIFMVRDGRATTHSIISRQVTITGFDLTSYRQCLKKWNTAIEVMNNQCNELGGKTCLRIPYEQLVLHPRRWMEKVLDFLDVRWHEAVLNHHDFINNGISLSNVERSSDQVIKPVNTEALSKWVGQIPVDVVRDMADIAPMLSVLGYDPYANPPNYGQPDDIVANNTLNIQRHKNDWERKAKEMFHGSAAKDSAVDIFAEKEPSDNPNVA